jgi:hypothetical protein
MNKIKLLLGTTALVGAGAMMSAPQTAHAAAVLPGGALDITLSGFIYMRAHGGDLDSARLNDAVSRDLDFSNDTEVHVTARGKHDATGIEYGGEVQFETDTNTTHNTDETWLFLRGGFGELRFGDGDGPIDNSAVGAFTIGAGTGGIDGSVIDTIGTSVVKPFNSDDDTKIRYYTPSFGGFQLGVSYTPNVGGVDTIQGSTVNNANLTPDTGANIHNFFEGALVYTGSFGGLDVKAAGVGGWCDNQTANQSDDCYSYGGGASVGLFGFTLAGGYFGQKIGPAKKQFFNAGVATKLGPVHTSVTYGRVVDSNNLNVNMNGDPATPVSLDHPSNLVFSADIGLMPGLVLAGDLGIFNNDVNGSTPGTNVSDNGWQGVVRIGLDF